MDSKTKNLIETLKNNQGAVQNIMQSPDGQELMRQLSGKDGGQSLQKATQAAAQGDPAALMKMMSGLMKSPEGAALLNRINTAVRK